MSVGTNKPLVSCLMVTRNRADLARRAVECFERQSWPSKELVIIDDGEQDYGPMLEPYRANNTIHYHRVPDEADVFLGGLRNASLDKANGEYWMQWDDDEWYDPSRIETQMRAILDNDWAGCTLRYTLMHLDDPTHIENPYRTSLAFGTPGTICHARTDVRYPNMRKGEDSVFLRNLKKEGKIGVLGQDQSHLFVRCFHGQNTWEQTHFTERLHKGPMNMLRYFWANTIKGDLHAHPFFQLSAAEQKTTREFLQASRELGLFSTG